MRQWSGPVRPLRIDDIYLSLWAALGPRVHQR